MFSWQSLGASLLYLFLEGIAFIALTLALQRAGSVDALLHSGRSCCRLASQSLEELGTNRGMIRQWKRRARKGAAKGGKCGEEALRARRPTERKDTLPGEERRR